MKRFFPYAAILLLVAIAAFLESPSFTRLWKDFLVVDAPLARADAIIVLGGEASARPQEAARLYRLGVAPRIFVTGIGDATRNRLALLSSGVPQEAIILETEARTTHANALNLKPLLQASDVHTGLIVTSPFHTRRALATFRTLIPGVKFGVVSATLPYWKESRGRRELNNYAMVELLKTLEYQILYGISPESGAARDRTSTTSRQGS